MKIIKEHKEDIIMTLAVLCYTIYCIIIFAIVAGLIFGIPTYAIIKIIEAIKN